MKVKAMLTFVLFLQRYTYYLHTNTAIHSSRINILYHFRALGLPIYKYEIPINRESNFIADIGLIATLVP